MEPILEDDWTNIDVVFFVLWSVNDNGSMSATGVLSAVMAWRC